MLGSATTASSRTSGCRARCEIRSEFPSAPVSASREKRSPSRNAPSSRTAARPFQASSPLSTGLALPPLFVEPRAIRRRTGEVSPDLANPRAVVARNESGPRSLSTTKEPSFGRGFLLSKALAMASETVAEISIRRSGLVVEDLQARSAKRHAPLTAACERA
jgi:hypothetical protein